MSSIRFLSECVFEPSMALLECNIGARGRAVRLKQGIMGVVVGLALAPTFYLTGVDMGLVWLIPLGAIGGGGFAIFESWAGWCVVRAFGFKTSV